MTIEELMDALENIPETGAFNIARRNIILSQIYQLMGEEEETELEEEE